MKLAHYSDTHGLIHRVPDPDTEIIVHSGDFCANYRPMFPSVEVPWQEGWLRAYKDHWKTVFGARPVLFVPGNHDFCDVTYMLREIGIDAYNLHEEWYEHRGIWFAGFKYVPEIGNSFRWMNEARDHDMQHLMSLFHQDWSRHAADVLVTHGPAYGIRDMENGTHYGCKHLADFLKHIYSKPRWHLHGHIHASVGFGMNGSINVSNAAQSLHHISL